MGSNSRGVTELMFEAVLDATCWTQFLKSTSRRLQARSAFIMSMRLSPDHRPCHEIGIADSLIRKYYEYYHHVDPWWAPIDAGAPGQARLVCGEAQCADGDLLASEFYTDFLRPHGLRYMRALAITPEAPHAAPFIVSWLRGPDAAPFDAADEDFIRELGPQLVQAERLGAELLRARIDDGDGREPAMFVLGPNGWLLQTNEPGRRMIQQGLFDASGALRPASADAAGWLHAHLASGTLETGFRPVLDPWGERGGTCAGNAGQARRSDRAKLPKQRIIASLGAAGRGIPHVLEMRALGRTRGVVSLTGATALMTVRPAHATDNDSLADRTSRLYGWTPTEFDTVWRLYQNASTQQISEARNCSVETVRTHLKHAKRKAGVRRQVELVTLVMQLQAGREP